MARHKLTFKQVEFAKPGRHGDGQGLYLVVSSSGSKKWVFRYTRNGRPTEMGLGGSTVTLAEARLKADEARKLSKAGGDPMAVRAAERARRQPTFGEIADEFILAKETEWRNAKHKAQWRMCLDVYAASLRKKRVEDIDTADVLAVLKPIWNEKAETASRVRGRIEAVLDAAKARGYRKGENPAAWRGHLAHLLPRRQRLQRGHHAALRYSDIAEFMKKLRASSGTAASALEFVILTAARTGEAIGATWNEFNFVENVWIVPADRMKSGRIHRVPLPARAVEILEELKKESTGDIVFAGRRGDRPISNMSMAMLMRRMKQTATVHGFRSAFRDWAGNETGFQRETIEAALAHVLGDKVEAAYRRSDALEKRRALMDAWAQYIEPEREDDNVVRLRSAGMPSA